MRASILKSLLVLQDTKSYARDLIHIILGCLYIALVAQIEIPLQPIPVTLHTFAILSLALAQGSRKALGSVGLYLLAASFGLPVFPSAYSNSLWMLLPSAGYCLSFPFIAYLVGKASDKSLSGFPLLLNLCLSHFILYSMGVTWLSTFCGWEQALHYGLYPFLLFDALKILVVTSGYTAFRKFR